MEAHLRRAEWGLTLQQLLLRPAISFHPNPNIVLSLGYSFYRNYVYEEQAFTYPFNEHHIWEQVELANPIGRFSFSHRLRFEQRYIETYLTDSTGTRGGGTRYLNRFRYRFSATVPLSREKLDKNTLFLSAYDELFLTFGDDSRLDGVQQNRLSGLVGWQLDPFGSSIQLGFLYQTVQFPRPPVSNPNVPGQGLTDDLIENNRTVHLIVTWKLDFRGNKAFVPWLPRGGRTIKTEDKRIRQPRMN